MLAGLALTILVAPLLGAASAKPPTVIGSMYWATAGSRVVFDGAIGNRTALWSEKLGSNKPKRIASGDCSGGGELPNKLAVGPRGSVGCLDIGVGNTSYTFNLGMVTAEGVNERLASVNVAIDENGRVSSPESIPAIFGDGKFLGYLYVTADGVVRLMQIKPNGGTRHVADLNELSVPGQDPGSIVSVDSGRITVRKGGDVHVYTTAGKRVAAFSAKAADSLNPTVAIRKNRIVVLTNKKRIAVYTLHGRLIHSYPARGLHPGFIATYGGYVVYIESRADSAPVHSLVHALKLATGADRVIARSGKGWFWSGVSIQAPGVVVPVTTKKGKQFPVTFRFVPMARVRAIVAEKLSQAARVSARLTGEIVPRPRAGAIKLVYTFTKPSTRFDYVLERRQGKRWGTLRSVHMTGRFRGSHSVTIKELFGRKPLRVGKYRLQISAEAGGRVLEFSIVRLLSNASTVSAGAHHGCALLSGGRIECWGDNRSGQLGNGKANEYPNYFPVRVKGIGSAVQVSAGDATTCAVLAGGVIKCWGANNRGILGDGTTIERKIPVTVKGIANAVQVSAGGNQTCAVLSDGTVSCWGFGGGGNLGNGTKKSSPVPVQVSGITNAVAISDTCALLADGGVKCWGYRPYGLGDGVTTMSSTPVQVAGITNAVAISTSAFHACALLSDGSAECWGSNIFGQLGDGSTIDSSTPVPVKGISGATQVSVGQSHTCALLSNRTLKCWGDGLDGQLGTGSKKGSSGPVFVKSITVAIQVSSADGYTCAALSNGAVRCWGANIFGQLGSGAKGGSTTPVDVVYSIS